MQPVCLLIAIFELAQASSLRTGAAGEVRETREQRTAFLSLSADTPVDDSFLSVAESSRDKGSTSSQNGTLSTASCLYWDRQVGLYCSENWDAPKAKANGVNKQACMQQCLDENTNTKKGCKGVSVTNQKWGDRSPWCHLCYSSSTKDHANLNTYWLECLSPTERKERDLAAKLMDIEAIEQRLCSAPGEVSAKEFQMIGDKAKLEKQYYDKHKEVVAEKDKEMEKLKQRQLASEQDCKSLSQDCDKTKEDCKKRDLLRKIACRSARQYEEMIGNLENSGKKEKEREERALEMELKSIHTQMQELKAKENAKAEKLKEMQDRQDAMSWDDFGFPR